MRVLVTSMRAGALRVSPKTSGMQNLEIEEEKVNVKGKFNAEGQSLYMFCACTGHVCTRCCANIHHVGTTTQLLPDEDRTSGYM